MQSCSAHHRRNIRKCNLIPTLKWKFQGCFLFCCLGHWRILRDSFKSGLFNWILQETVFVPGGRHNSKRPRPMHALLNSNATFITGPTVLWLVGYSLLYWMPPFYFIIHQSIRKHVYSDSTLVEAAFIINKKELFTMEMNNETLMDGRHILWRDVLIFFLDGYWQKGNMREVIIIHVM